MKRALVLTFTIVACGGGSKKPAETPKPTDTEASAPAPTEKKDEPPPEPEKPAPPPAPKMWHAKASLDPVKGQKIKASGVAFTQEEGKGTQVAAASGFDGIKPGKYHLVVHDSKECGANAAKAGKATAVDVAFEVKKGETGNVDQSDVADASLGGDASVVGKVLVLHDDKKGKPGKALACGVISGVEDEDDAAKKE